MTQLLKEEEIESILKLCLHEFELHYQRAHSHNDSTENKENKLESTENTGEVDSVKATQDKNCRKLLLKVRNVFLRISAYVKNVPEKLRENEKFAPLVLRVCDFLFFVLEARFCPHSHVIFGYGNVAAVAPTFRQVMAFLLEPSVYALQLEAKLYVNAKSLFKMLAISDLQFGIIAFTDTVKLIRKALIQQRNTKDNGLGNGALGYQELMKVAEIESKSDRDPTMKQRSYEPLKLNLACSERRNQCGRVALQLCIGFISLQSSFLWNLPCFLEYVDVVCDILHQGPMLENAEKKASNSKLLLEALCAARQLLICSRTIHTSLFVFSKVSFCIIRITEKWLNSQSHRYVTDDSVWVALGHCLHLAQVDTQKRSNWADIEGGNMQSRNQEKDKRRKVSIVSEQKVYGEGEEYMLFYTVATKPLLSCLAMLRKFCNFFPVTKPDSHSKHNDSFYPGVVIIFRALIDLFTNLLQKRLSESGGKAQGQVESYSLMDKRSKGTCEDELYRHVSNLMDERLLQVREIHVPIARCIAMSLALKYHNNLDVITSVLKSAVVSSTIEKQNVSSDNYVENNTRKNPDDLAIVNWILENACSLDLDFASVRNDQACLSIALQILLWFDNAATQEHTVKMVEIASRWLILVAEKKAAYQPHKTGPKGGIESQSSKLVTKLDIAVDVSLTLSYRILTQKKSPIFSTILGPVNAILRLCDNSMFTPNIPFGQSGRRRLESEKSLLSRGIALELLDDFEGSLILDDYLNQSGREKRKVLPDECKPGWQTLCEVCFLPEISRNGKKSTGTDANHLLIPVKTGETSFRYAHSLSLIERFVILSSSLPTHLFDEFGLSPDDCMRIVSSGLYSTSSLLQMRAMLQLPSLLGNLRIPCSIVEKYLESLAEDMNTLSQSQIGIEPNSIISHRTVMNFQTLRSFISRLGSLLSAENPDIVELQICSVSTAYRLTALPLLEDRTLAGTAQHFTSSTANVTDSFACICHATTRTISASVSAEDSVSNPGTRITSLGDIPGSLFLWERMLKAVVNENSKLSSELRVAMVRCCASILRRLVHIAIITGKDSGLSRERFGVSLKRFLYLLEDKDALVRKALAEEISVFIDGCGGGREYQYQCKREHNSREGKIDGDRESAIFNHSSFPSSKRSSEVSEISVGRGLILSLIFREGNLQSDNVTEFFQRIVRLVAKYEKSSSPKLEMNNSIPFSHTMLTVLGSIGCTADVSYVVLNEAGNSRRKIGSELLIRSLFQLTKQWVAAIAQYSQALEKKDRDGILSASLLKVNAYNELERIAVNRGYGSSDKQAAIWSLFDSCKQELYVQLLVMFWTEPFKTQAPDALEIFLKEVLGGKFYQAGKNGIERLPSARRLKGNQDCVLDSNSSDENKMVSFFLKDSLSCILPPLLTNLKENYDILLDIGRRINKNKERNRKDVYYLKTLIINNSNDWIVELLEPLAEKQNQTSGNGKVVMTDCWKDLLRVTELSIKDIFELSQKKILNHVVFRLVSPNGEPNTRSQKLLGILGRFILIPSGKQNDEKENPNRKSRDKDTKSKIEPNVIRVVRPNFMYMMGVLSERIEGKFESESRRCHALRCAARLLVLLDSKEVDTFVPKILPTLKIALEEPNARIQIEACHTMHELINRLSDNCLRKNLNTFVASLLPCLRPIQNRPSPNDSKSSTYSNVKDNVYGAGQEDSYITISDDDSNIGTGEEMKLQMEAEARAISTMRSLIVVRRDAMRSALMEVHELVPTTYPPLEEIVKVLQQERGKPTLGQRMQQLVNLIQHDSESVKLLAMDELNKVLVSHSKELNEILLSENEQGSCDEELQATSLVHKNTKTHSQMSKLSSSQKPMKQVVSELVAVLLAASRKSGGQRVRQSCAECLGELGAIDPMRLDLARVRMKQKGETEMHTVLDLGNEALASHLLKVYLVPSLRAAPNPDAHMKVGMAIQELLAFFTSLGYASEDVATGSGDNSGGLQGGFASVVDLAEETEDKTAEGTINRSKLPSRWISDDIQETIRPFWKDLYEIASEIVPAEPQARRGSKKRTFFGPGVRCENSIREWFIYLIDYCKGPQASIFRSLCILRRYESATDMFLFVLPYVIQNILCSRNINHSSNSENSKELDNMNKNIFEEIKIEVLSTLADTWQGKAPAWYKEAGLADPNSATAADTSSHYTDGNNKLNQDTMASINSTTHKRKRNQGIGDSEDGFSEDTEHDNGNDNNSPVQMRVQAMFYILDVLTSWTNRMRIINAQTKIRMSSNSMSMNMSKPNIDRTDNSASAYDGDWGNKSEVSRLIRCIPPIALTEAAYACGAYHRALKYLEDHLRSTHAYPYCGITLGSWRGDQPVQFERDEVEQLHRIYTRLDSEKVDGLAGIAKIRSRHNGGPSTGYLLGTTERTSCKWKDIDIDADKTQAETGGVEEPTLSERINELECAEQWENAIACYEESIHEMESSVGANKGSILKNNAYLNLHRGQLECVRRAGNLELLVSLARGKASEYTALQSTARKYETEALWRLQRWSQLKRIFRTDEVHCELAKTREKGAGLSSINVSTGMKRGNKINSRVHEMGLGLGERYYESMAQAILCIVQMNQSNGYDSHKFEKIKTRFESHIKKGQLEIIDLLSAASMESYYRAYPLLLRLHLFSELRSGWDIVHLSKAIKFDKKCAMALGSKLGLNVSTESNLSLAPRELIIKKGWDTRMKLTAASTGMRQELFEGRRVIFSLAGLYADEMQGWLTLSKTAMQAGHLKACLSSLLKLNACTRKEFGSTTPTIPTLTVASSVTASWHLNAVSGKEESEAILWQARVQRAEVLQQQQSNANGLHAALMSIEPVEVNVVKVTETLKNSHQSLRYSRAEAILFATNLMVKSGQMQGKEVVRRYKQVLKLRPAWEKGYFFLGKFYDYLYQQLRHEESKDKVTGNDKASKTAEYKIFESDALLPAIIKQYGESLKYGGYDHLYESLPRLLTLWFSNMERMHEEEQKILAQGEPDGSSTRRRSGRAQQRNAAKSTGRPTAKTTTHLTDVMSRLNSHVQDLGKMLPGFLWYTALPQLVSRITHPSPSVWNILEGILSNIVSRYPAQSLWHIMGVVLSKMELRKKRASRVLDQVMKENEPLRKRIRSSKYIFEALVKLALHSPSNRERRLRVAQFLGGSRFRQRLEDSKLTMPINSALTARLPNFVARNDISQRDNAPDVPISSQVKEYCPFSENAPSIKAFHEWADLMNSKERPKKIKIIGSDGLTRNFLCKNEHKGDLRKDSRMMELNTVVNRLFQRDVQARRRRLRLRTYAVVCLNEECGVLEWVENTEGFRPVIQQVYSELGHTVSLRSGLRQYRVILENLQKDSTLNKDQKLQQYRTKILQHFSPIFHKWFLNRFCEPECWLDARVIFTRSAAVWSMVGHIIGLGDRHAENLLLDVTSGECVHVDFDCIFDKGLDLLVPEIVPFRLTPFMVDGMDISGVDGIFRRTCEIALDVLRSNKDVLFSMLQAFENDPLVEWTRVKQNQGQDGNVNQVQGKLLGQDRLKGVQERLDGIVRDRKQVAESRKRKRTPLKTKNSAGSVFEVLPLSTQGQVHRLIMEALDEENLMKMYSGWAPFL